MKRKDDAGLAYLKKINVSSVRSAHQIYNDLVRICGKERTREYLDTLRELENNGDRQAFYEYKNAEPDIALIYTGEYDADILRKTCNYIAEHIECFGTKILDVGCDCGLMSCFLAYTFPESEVFAIDRGGNGLEIGKQIAEKLGLSNISFQKALLSDLDKDAYDTVFSMRLLQENRMDDDRDPVLWPLMRQAEEYYLPVVSDWAVKLSEPLKDGGTLVCVDRCERDPLFLGWWMALDSAGLRLIEDSCHELECTEVGEETRLLAFAAYKGLEIESYGIEKLYKIWKGEFLQRTQEHYQGWEAEAMLKEFSNEMICGYLLKDRNGTPVGKYAVLTIRENSDSLMRYHASRTERHIDIVPLTQQKQITDSLEMFIINQEKLGFEVKKISAMEDIV